MTEGTLTLTEAAARIGVHRRTLRAWKRAGRLPFIVTPGGRYRVRVADLDAMPLTTAEFARAVGVSQRTALRWVHAGKVRARRSPSGQLWIEAGEVERVGARRA